MFDPQDEDIVISLDITATFTGGETSTRRFHAGGSVMATRTDPLVKAIMEREDLDARFIGVTVTFPGGAVSQRVKVSRQLIEACPKLAAEMAVDQLISKRESLIKAIVLGMEPDDDVDGVFLDQEVDSAY